MMQGDFGGRQKSLKKRMEERKFFKVTYAQQKLKKAMTITYIMIQKVISECINNNAGGGAERQHSNACKKHKYKCIHKKL